MKYGITFFLSAIIASGMAQSQNRPASDYFSYQLTSLNFKSPARKWPLFLSPDRQLTYRLRSPLAMTLASSAVFKGENYWMGSMTTQSYNQGKLGTYYMWDVQGNLRESRMFLDIAGKNKRGLKLVFRRR